MEVRRGAVAIIVLPGDYGKVRPAAIVQTDLINEAHGSFILCPFTTELRAAPGFRVTVEPSPENGLRERSQVMVDKVTSLKRERLRAVVGRLDAEAMQRVDRVLAVLLGLV